MVKLLCGQYRGKFAIIQKSKIEMQNDNAKIKNFIRANWWKALLIIWLIYAIIKLSNTYFRGSILEIVFFAVIAFAAGYGFGKNSK